MWLFPTPHFVTIHNTMCVQYKWIILKLFEESKAAKALKTLPSFTAYGNCYSFHIRDWTHVYYVCMRQFRVRICSSPRIDQSDCTIQKLPSSKTVYLSSAGGHVEDVAPVPSSQPEFLLHLTHAVDGVISIVYPESHWVVQVPCWV